MIIHHHIYGLSMKSFSFRCPKYCTKNISNSPWQTKVQNQKIAITRLWMKKDKKGSWKKKPHFLRDKTLNWFWPSKNSTQGFEAFCDFGWEFVFKSSFPKTHLLLLLLLCVLFWPFAYYYQGKKDIIIVFRYSYIEYIVA